MGTSTVAFMPLPFPCLLFPSLNIWIFQLVIKRLKEAGLYSAEDLATAGRGNILPESVIEQLLPADADEASRKALNVIFDVGRQALPGSRRLCLRQLRNKQGISEVQTCTASSLVALSCWFVEHVSHASFSSAESTVTFTGMQRGDEFSPRPRCFLFLEELGTHCPRYNLCFSAPFPARETNRQLQAAAFRSSFSGSDSILQMRKCAVICFSQFKSLGWDPWCPTERQVAAFLQDTRVKRKTHANRMLRAPGMDSGSF